MPRVGTRQKIIGNFSLLILFNVSEFQFEGTKILKLCLGTRLHVQKVRSLSHIMHLVRHVIFKKIKAWVR